MYAGLFLPNNYIIVQAQDEGMSDYLAGKMVIILNAASSKSLQFTGISHTYEQVHQLPPTTGKESADRVVA